MERYLLRKTMDYESMVDLFVRSGLDISPEDPRPEGLITCFELVDVQENKRIGASGLCCAANEYILRCVAVEEEFQGMGYGRKLVEAVTAEAGRLGAKRIWLTAKVPEFYKKFQFQVAPREEAPFVSKCGECPQYHNGCESEVMVYYF